MSSMTTEQSENVYSKTTFIAANKICLGTIMGIDWY